MTTHDIAQQAGFLNIDQASSRVGKQIVDELVTRFGTNGLTKDAFGLVLAVPGPDGRARGFAHRGNWRCYPCSLVKTFHLVHVLAALEQGRVQQDAELDRAMRAMIKWSSNTATNYVIDLLSDTTGDTLLGPDALAAWIARRGVLNQFFARLGWPEFAPCNITQKLMDDTRYGREAQYAGFDGRNLNALTPLAAARLMWAIWEGGLPLSVASQICAQEILIRDAKTSEAVDPNYQLSEYLGGRLPDNVRVWSKAGHNLWTGDASASWFKHDMVRIAGPDRAPLTMVLMTQGKYIASELPFVFPEIGRLIWEMSGDL